MSRLALLTGGDQLRPVPSHQWPQVLGAWLIRAVGTAVPRLPGIPPHAQTGKRRVELGGGSRLFAVSGRVSETAHASLPSWALAPASPTSDSPGFSLCFPGGQGLCCVVTSGQRGTVHAVGLRARLSGAGLSTEGAEAGRWLPGAAGRPLLPPPRPAAPCAVSAACTLPVRGLLGQAALSPPCGCHPGVCGDVRRATARERIQRCLFLMLWLKISSLETVWVPLHQQCKSELQLSGAEEVPGPEGWARARLPLPGPGVGECRCLRRPRRPLSSCSRRPAAPRAGRASGSPPSVLDVLPARCLSQTRSTHAGACRPAAEARMWPAVGDETGQVGGRRAVWVCLAVPPFSPTSGVALHPVAPPCQVTARALSLQPPGRLLPLALPAGLGVLTALPGRRPCPWPPGCGSWGWYVACSGATGARSAHVCVHPRGRWSRPS